MKLRPLFTGAAFLAASGLATFAEAAYVSDFKGEVLVSRGEGFSLIQEPVQLGPGDKVVVRPGGIAYIVFEDGCKVTVEPGHIMNVGDLSPCKAASASEAGTGLSSSTMLVGGLAIAGGVGIAVGLSGSSNDKKPHQPASP